LIAEGALDHTLKVRREGDFLLLPVISWREGAEQQTFDAQPGRPRLPAHELIGGIAILQEDDPDGAAQVLAARPNLHTVLFATSEVEGMYRTKSFKTLAGVPTTRTEVIEHGHRFAIDLSAAYFSARLATERQRIAALVEEGELILDMFAGVGPFAIAVAGKAGLVLAADFNPQAVMLMLENITTNRMKTVIPVLGDSRHLADTFSLQFDRIIMNLPKSGEEYLPAAFGLCKPGGTIHFYALVSREKEHNALVRNLGGKIVTERVVRSYSPAQWHAVYDIKKENRT
jgi:tRNA (guanine37-N1)-methyltransferase